MAVGVLVGEPGVTVGRRRSLVGPGVGPLVGATVGVVVGPEPAVGLMVVGDFVALIGLPVETVGSEVLEEVGVEVLKVG